MKKCDADMHRVDGFSQINLNVAVQPSDWKKRLKWFVACFNILYDIWVIHESPLLLGEI
jgi:hypothetical protein